MTNDQKNFTYALERAIAHSSLEVLNGETQLYSLVADYLGGSPQSRQSMNLLRNAIACGIPARMYGAANKDTATQNITVATCRKLLIDNYGSGEEAAGRFMNEFAAALGWKVETAPPAQQKEEAPLKNTVTGTPKQETPQSGTGGARQDYSEEVRLYKKAAEQGDVAAQNKLGNCYYSGAGVRKDYAEAVRWYKKAAEQGYADAQDNLGACYYSGEGVEKDYAEAVRWYRMAAEQGNACRQYNLGRLYYDGDGVKQDYAEAVRWFQKAAEQGDEGAQSTLGDCYYHGLGVPQDYAEAERWYRMAAEQGNSWAQYTLGCNYYRGRGVTKNLTEARKWLEKAAAKWNKDAGDLLRQMNRNGE